MSVAVRVTRSAAERSAGDRRAVRAVRGAGGAARRPDARHRVSGFDAAAGGAAGSVGSGGAGRLAVRPGHRACPDRPDGSSWCPGRRDPPAGPLGRHRPSAVGHRGLPAWSRTVAVGAFRQRRRVAGARCRIGPAGSIRAAPNAMPQDPAPLYAVCAHGTHDVCCAIRGRPVAAALDRVRPGQVWESSHVGGDRFAANVLVLPSGVLYGRVVESAAGALVEAVDRGGVLHQHLRGRVGFQPDVQAAMALAYQERPDLRVADVRVVGEHPHRPGRHPRSAAARRRAGGRHGPGRALRAAMDDLPGGRAVQGDRLSTAVAAPSRTR